MRLGILSTARIARRIVAAAQAIDVIDVVAVASRDRERARAYAAEHDIPRAHESYETLLGDPEIDAVYVPLPNAMHVPWTVAALEAGKHVLCEKPLAPSREHAQCAFDAAHRAERVLVEAFMYRHHPQVRLLQRLVAEGAIGEPRVVHASFSFPVPAEDAVRIDPDLGGGALLDAGTYGVHAARLLCGEPREAIGRARLGDSGVDRSFHALLRFADGATAHVEASHELPRRQHLEVVGEQGSIVLDEPWLVFGAGRVTLTRREHEPEDVTPPPADPYRLELEHFAALARGDDGTSPLPDERDALAQAYTLGALHESALAAADPSCAQHMSLFDHA